MANELNEILQRVAKLDADLGADLRKQVTSLTSLRPNGLNFERHLPESVTLPGRPISAGDTVRFVPPRGQTEVESHATWVVTKLTGPKGAKVANLLDRSSGETTTREVEDLVYIADFRDPIYPGLQSSRRVERGGDKPFHTVINAENYHALEALQFTHAGKVDAIYIDPPYNSGARDWKYNNDYVDGTDDYRHSKWLSFMERRLKLAETLLNPRDSVLIITIDEKEYLRLGLLLEQTFPNAKIQMVTIVINPNGVERGAELARVEEYAYFCFFGTSGPSKTVDTMLGDEDRTRAKSVRWEWLMRGGSNSRRIDRPNLFYPIYIDETTPCIVDVGEPIPIHADPDDVPNRPGLKTLWPIRTNGEHANWRTSPEYLRELLDRGCAKLGAYDARSGRWSILYLGKAQIRRIEAGELVVLGANPDGSLILETGDAGISRSVKTVWNRSRHSAGEHGSRLLRALLSGRSFPFPKSLYAVEDTLRIAVADKPNAVIVDFFSGSGTTAHAVMRLNRQDGGRRRSISVTNNEVSVEEHRALIAKDLRPGDPEWESLGICDYITKPRIEAAVTGKTPTGAPIKGDYKFTDEFPMAEGFEENVEFLTLTYLNPKVVELDLAFTSIAPLLWMRAGSQGRRITERAETFDIADTYAVLFSVDAAAAFLKAVDDQSGLRAAFIVTDDEPQFQAIAAQLPEGIEAVRLYESYLRTFEINTDRA